uniref:DUF3800 domain-containing protein n=1 Tax=Thermodesulfobacterium geofontis TaxID=1295609 RepID=A0A7V5XF11_9BACT
MTREEMDKINNHYVLFIDEVGDWKNPLYIVGGLVFNLCDFWDITTEIRNAKKEILGKKPHEEFKWNECTCIEKSNEKNKLKVKEYIDVATNIIKDKSETFLAAIVDLKRVILWNEWKEQKQNDNKKKYKTNLDKWVRETCMKDLIDRYQNWLEENKGLGLIIIDRYRGPTKYAEFEKEHIGVLTSLIYDGSKYRENYCNIIPPLFANSEFYALFDINDYGLGAFSYVLRQLYDKKEDSIYYEQTLKLYQVVLDKVRKSKDGKIWGYGLIDIPKNFKPLLRNVISEDVLYNVIKI